MKLMDRRIQKTNHSLQNAFKRVSKTITYKEITVKKLTEEAHISRKTFYLHYDSIEDFLNTFVDEVSSKLLAIITKDSLKISLAKPGYIFDEIFNFFQESRDFYTFMMTSPDYNFISQKIEIKVTEGFSKTICNEFKTSKLDSYIIASFLIGNTLMLFRIFHTKENTMTKSEFRNRLIRLNSSGLSSFLDINREINE